MSNLTNKWRQKLSYPFLLSCSVLDWSIHKSCFNNLMMSWLFLLCQFKSTKSNLFLYFEEAIKFIMMILLPKELRLNMEKSVIQEMIMASYHPMIKLSKCGKLINLLSTKMRKTTKINKEQKLIPENSMSSWNGGCWQVLHF